MQTMSEAEGPPLPLSSLRLFVSPLRLVSAALWQVVQRRDIMDYGLLEDFVATVFEIVPDLMCYRERVQLIMGLRARLVLELCRSDRLANPETIQPHLNKMRSCIASQKEKEVSNAEVETSETNFQKLIRTLLEDPVERVHFFQNVFPKEFGPKYDSALQSLVWEFLTRLEKLLPSPTLEQTASWLSPVPSVLKECIQSVSHPQPLKTLLQHHYIYGHLQTNAPSSVDNYILSSLALSLSETAEHSSEQADSQIQTEPMLGFLHIQRPGSPDNDDNNDNLFESNDMENKLDWTDSDRTVGVETVPLSQALESASVEGTCVYKETSDRHIKNTTQESIKEGKFNEPFNSTQTDNGLEIRRPPHKSQQQVHDISTMSISCLLHQPIVLLHRVDITGMQLSVPDVSPMFHKRKKRLQTEEVGSQGQRGEESKQRVRNVTGELQPGSTETEQNVISRDDAWISCKKRKAGGAPGAVNVWSHFPFSHLEEEKLHLHIKKFHPEEHNVHMAKGHNRKKPSDCVQEPLNSLPLDSSHTMQQSPKRSKRGKICSLCGKTFIDAKDFTRHLRSHTDQSLRSHTDQSTYQCTLCGQGFDYTEDLQKHQKDECEEGGHSHSSMSPQPEEDHMSTTSVEEETEISQPQNTLLKSLTNSNALESSEVETLSRTCPVCDHTYSTVVSMRYHLKSVHDQRLCLVCGKIFVLSEPNNSDKVNHHHQHSRKAHPETSQSLDVLPIQGQSANVLKDDRTCLLCNVTFDNKENMRTHQKFQHDVFFYACLHCGKSFESMRDKRKHSKQCLSKIPDPKECCECRKKRSQSTQKQKAVCKAVNLERQQQDLSLAAGGNEMEIPQSSSTGIGFSEHLQQHQSNQFEDRRSRQYQQMNDGVNPNEHSGEVDLDDSSKTRTEILQPQSTSLQNPATSDAPPTPPSGVVMNSRTCPLCYKMFFNKSSMNQHLTRHTQGQGPFTCTICSKSFGCAKDLKRHQRKKLGCGSMYHNRFVREAPAGYAPVVFSCCHCQDQFKSEHGLKAHMIRHTGDGFSCKYCGKMFLDKRKLYHHIRNAHTTRPHLCDICGKDFATKYTLKSHMRVHTGERPYPCRVCDKRFASSGAQSDHMKLHTGECTFACTFCKMSFITISSLRRHVLIHTGERPFGCKICGKSFRAKYAIRKHKCP